MLGKKGMKNYPEEIKKEIKRQHKEGKLITGLSKEYGISRYAIQSWCGLRQK